MIVAALGLVLWLAAPAGATWSIVATDPVTGQVGAAIASCVPGRVLGEPEEALLPIALIPGRAAGVAQAQINVFAPDRIVVLIEAGESPRDIVDELASPEYDEQAALRQHAVVRIDGSAAAFTGVDNSPEALDAQDVGVSVQGNLLVSPTVVESALAGYTQEFEAGGDLAEALVAGLLAGSSEGGDRRCPDQTALFAQIVVAAPDDDGRVPSTLLTVLVAEGDGNNPVEVMASSFADGERGVIDLSERVVTSTGQLRNVVLVVAALAAVVAVVVFKRGLGSTAARR